MVFYIYIQGAILKGLEQFLPVKWNQVWSVITEMPRSKQNQKTTTNETNKKQIGQKGFLPLFMEISKSIMVILLCMYLEKSI